MALADMADRYLASHKTRRRGLVADVNKVFDRAVVGSDEVEWLQKLRREVLAVVRDSGALVTKSGKAVRRPKRSAR